MKNLLLITLLTPLFLCAETGDFTKNPGSDKEAGSSITFDVELDH
jgi:hypothetical protein